jgi:murein DD-endopeptidase MepM/ murein hydrolase activator NlpD
MPSVIRECQYQIVNPVGKPGEFYPIGSGFGSRPDPINGDPDWHGGIDIPAATGTPVRAAMDGMVTYAYFTPTGGNTIHIDHGNGLQTRYLHMNVYITEVGEFVRAGTQIGAVGQTGRVTGPHLHFEMRMQDDYIDPTQCYNNALTTWTNPYTIPADYSGATEDYTAPPPSDGKPFPWWMVILGVAVVGTVAVVATSDRDNKKTPAKRVRRR